MNKRDWSLITGSVASTAIAMVVFYETVEQPPAPSANQRSRVIRDEPSASSGADAPEMAVLPLSGAPSEKPDSARLRGQLERVNGMLESVQREKRDLEAQLHALESELEGREEVARREFDLDREDWKQLAAEGRIKYRIPCSLHPLSPSDLEPEEQDKLGLSPEEGRTVRELHRRSNDRVWSTIRPLCKAHVNDDTAVELLERSDCLGLIERAAVKKDFEAAAQLRRHVGEVHAGLRPRPAPGEATHPLFAALLAITSEARLFEADLEEHFGPEEAKNIAQNLSCADTAK